jgi:SAM-dependent methyltransferase
MGWKDGYVADIEYVHGFYPELGPAVLNFVLLLNGFEPVPLNRHFTYCELGCGLGESLNMFAACHPEGRFHAIDFNPAHIEAARGIADRAQLSNTTFWEADFAGLRDLPLPEFDFITLHGVYSWVNTEKRRDIVEFINRRLKPGGVVYNGYNSMPGWSANAPLRELLTSYADTQSGPLLERIEHSVRFVEKLKGLDSAYFKANPSAVTFFDYISPLSRNYLAHEFFNRDWTLFYHADVAKDFAVAGLTFAGSARFIDFKDSLRFSRPMLQLLNEITDPVMRETLKDFAGNQQFRTDIFTLGRQQIPDYEQKELLLESRFSLVIPRGTFTFEATFPIGRKLLLPELYDPILSALEEQDHSLEELFYRPEIACLGAANVLEALIILCVAEYIKPAVEPSAEAVEVAWRYNISVLERAFRTTDSQFLASPVLQGGIALNWIQMLLLICELTKESDPVSFVYEYLRANDYKLSRDVVTLESEDDIRAELNLMFEKFRTQHLPYLQKLGIVISLG